MKTHLFLLIIAITTALASCAIDPTVKQKLITDGTGILITGGTALLITGNGGAALEAMSAEAIANVPGLKAVIADSVAKSAKNPAEAVAVTVTAAPATP